MAERNISENDLVAIRISLGQERDISGPPAIVLDIQRGSQLLHRAQVPTRECGVPNDFDPRRYRYGEPNWALSAPLLHELGEVVRQAFEGDEPHALWLYIAPPSGFLPLLPWERMLGSTFGVPLLRVPHFALFPPLDTQDIDIALCVSQPRAKEWFDPASVDALGVVAGVATSLVHSIPLPLTVHVFADAQTFEALHGHNLEGTVDQGTIVLHDPAGAPPADTRAGRGTIEDSAAVAWNPWLQWIAQEMKGRTLEAVHFIAHSYLAQNQAALAVAESPTVNEDERWARFIGSRQLSNFLNLVGAWAVGISSPQHNFSPMGSRLLIDDIAHQRAGPVVLHELGTDPESRGLGRTYFSLFASAWPQRPSDIAMYCHPRQFLSTSPGDRIPYAETLLDDSRSLARTPTADRPPAWMTLTRRYLEQSAASLFPEVEGPTSAAQEAAGEGVRQAMSFVTGVMEKIGAQGSDIRAINEHHDDDRRTPA